LADLKRSSSTGKKGKDEEEEEEAEKEEEEEKEEDDEDKQQWEWAGDSKPGKSQDVWVKEQTLPFFGAI
jgi:hypothetical protein